MPEFLASKVIVTEEAPTTRLFAPSPAAVTGIVGTAERGPMSQAILCTSFDDFERTFGSYASGADLPQSAKAFFDNGGTSLYVVRIAHYADVANRDSITAKRATGTLMAASKPVVDFQARDYGTFGNAVRVDLKGANSDLEVAISRGGQRLETYQHLSFDPGSKRYFVAIINAASPYVSMAPRDGYDAPVEPQGVQLVDGDNGLMGLNAADFIGHATARSGMRALDPVLDMSLLCIPSATPEVQQAMYNYAETERRNLFVLFSLPERTAAEEAVVYVTDTRLLESTEHAAAYWPRVLVRNPAPHVFDGRHIAVPPCAFLAGVMARVAGKAPSGIYTPPAGIDVAQLVGAVGLDHDDCLNERKRDLVFPKRINPLTTGPSLPIFVDGARTMKSSGLCPYVSHRRGMSYISAALWRQLQYVRHKPVTSTLLGRVHRDVNAYLMAQLAVGAFASQVPEKAFALNVTRSDTTGVIEIHVGLAFATPGEFVWLRLSAHNHGTGGI